MGFDLTSKKISYASSLRLDWEALWATACEDVTLILGPVTSG